MVYTDAFKIGLTNIRLTLWQVVSAVFLALLLVFSLYAQDNLPKNESNETIKAESGVDVYSYGKNVLVEKGVKAKSILAFGGDITIEGDVEEDVATIGGTIIQKENAFIGGDVIVFGGAYTHERKEPLRNKDKESVIIAVYENELKSIVQNPTQLFAPQFSLAFLAQRLLSTLFWFVVSLFFTTIAPGAVSRAVTRFQLSTSKIVGVGLLAFIIATLSVTAILTFLPNYLSVIIVLMVFVLLMLSLVYGRVTLQVATGKWLQKRFLSEDKRSESFALFLGTLFWMILTSIPYIWTFAVIFLFAVSLGLVITSRSNKNWAKAS